MKETKEDYVARQYAKAFQYEEDILSGKSLANEFIKQAIHRRKELEKKYHYDKKEVEKLFSFFYYINITSKGNVIQYEPIPWFAWVVMNLYGYYRDNTLSRRLFRFATIWIGRKNSKTTNAAILSLYALLKEERNPEVYFLGNTKAQASQALKYLKQIVKDSPALAKRIKTMQYQLRTEVNGTGYAVPLAADADLLDGLSPSFAVIDEKHAMLTNDLFNVIVTGTKARQKPLIITISTSGFFKDAPFYNELEIGKKILAGEKEDDATFYAFYTLDSEDEIDKPEMWAKANPSLSYILDLEDMIIDYKKACFTISDKINFQVKNLNVYADSETTWIPDEDYKKCFIDSDYERLKGEKCYIGLDLSSTRDLTSIVAVVLDPKSNKLAVFPIFYFPVKDNVNKIRKTGIDLIEWIDKGFIKAHKAKVIDYNKVIDDIQVFTKHFDVQAVSYDTWNASTVAAEIESKLMVDMLAAPQTATYFNLPIKYVERLIFNEEIELSKNPVLRYCFRNVVMSFDSNNNCKIAKNKALDVVDGTIALLMAVSGYMKLNWDSVAMVMDAYNEEIELNKQ